MPMWTARLDGPRQALSTCTHRWRHSICHVTRIVTHTMDVNNRRGGSNYRYQACTFIVCSTPLLAPRIGLYTASVVSLKDALIGWSASDYDASIQLWRIKINTGYTLPSPTWRASPTWRKQKAFPLPGTAALWVFWKSREFPAFFRGRGQSYARRHGTWNSLAHL